MECPQPMECDLIISHMLLPEDANPVGNIHGGIIVKHIDNAAGVVAMRHARGTVVTAAIDTLDFHNPAYIGNLLTVRAVLTWAGRTSMEIMVHAETENLLTGEIRHTATAFLTFVALDETGRPRPVPRIVPETEAEKRRFADAEMRRKARNQRKQSPR